MDAAVLDPQAPHAGAEDAGFAEALKDRRVFASIVLFLGALWLCTRPYWGIYHDARLYALQALNGLLPGRFAGDLFLRYGSQDQFTIFSLIYRPFIQVFGLWTGTIVLLAISQLIWIGGLIFLVRALVTDRRAALLSVAAVMVLPFQLTIEYGEPFLTPRLLSEALVLWALGFMLRRRLAPSLLLLALAMSVHPLVALSGIAVLFFYEGSRHKIWFLVAFLGFLAAIALAFAGVPPFSRFLQKYDDDWWAIVHVRNSIGLIAEWGIVKWMTLVRMSSFGVLGLCFASVNDRRFIYSIVVPIFLMMLVSVIGGDVLRNVLITDLQLWRSMLMLAIVAHIGIGPALLGLRRRDGLLFTIAGYLVLGALGLSAISGFYAQLNLAATPMVVVGVGAAVWERFRQNSRPLVLRVIVILFVGISIGLLVNIINGLFLDRDISHENQLAIFFSAIAALIIFYVLVALSVRPGLMLKLSTRPIVFGLAILMFLAALWNWDQAPPWVRFVDQSESPPKALADVLPGQGPVYWEGDPTVPWFVLKRPSYFSCDQGAGVLFNRRTAMDFQRSLEHFSAFDTLDSHLYELCPSRNEPTAVDHSKQDIAALCQSEPNLTDLVLIKPVRDVEAKIWDAPTPFTYVTRIDDKWQRMFVSRFYIYSCKDFRS